MKSDADAKLLEKLTELGLPLPSPAEPKGLYKPLVVVGRMAYTSGHVPIGPDGAIVTGRLGADLDEEAGRQAAELAAAGILSTLQATLGSLGRVRRLLKILGFVNGTDDFTQQPAVMNGASQLFADVLGADVGVGARSAVGANSLPLGAAVEVEAIFEIEIE